MSAELAATFFTMGYAQTVAQSMEQNKVDVLVLTPSQYLSILQDKSRNNPRLEATLRNMLSNTALGRYWGETIGPNVSEPWVAPTALGANDALMITKTLNALGMAGITSYIKNSAGGTYIIIKGYAANRSSALQGTRYLATHPQMLQLGLGAKSLQGVAKGGFVLGIVVSAGIEIADFIFNDEKTMYDLVGGIGVEAVKGGLAGLLAYAAAAGIGMVTTVAVAPLIIMAVAAVGFGFAINYVDNKLGIKAKVVEALKAVPENADNGLYYMSKAANVFEAGARDSVQKQMAQGGRAIDQAFRDWFCRIGCRRY